MAVTFNDWFDFGTSQYTGTSNYIINGNGVYVTSSTAFDYFNDAPAVGNTFELGSNRIWKDIKFYVGTPMNGTPTFVWEYKTTSGTWATLKVLNGDAFTKSGEQIVSFTPPKDWQGAYNDRPLHRIRCRLTGVTGVTEGGAQSTQKVQCGNMAFRVTGTGNTASTVLANNNATGYTILTPTTPATGIVPIEMPHLRLGLSDRLDVTLSGTSAGAGDTVVLTGVDKDNNSQTETIDVSGGNGTYTSTKQFKNITQVDCNGFADGTIAVATKTRGMMSNFGNFYFWAAHLFIGDNSTTTTFTSTSEQWYFDRQYNFTVTNAATLSFGTEDTGGDVTGTSNWCYVYLLSSTNVYDPNYYLCNTGGTLNIYGSTILSNATTGSTKHCLYGTVNIRDSRISLGGLAWAATTTLNNTEVQNLLADVGFFASGSTLNGLKVNQDINMYNNRTRPIIIVSDSYFETFSNFNNFDPGRKVEFIDCPNLTTSDITNTASNYAGTDGIYIENHFDLKVIDVSGNPISGAAVVIKDVFGTQVASISTDANGDITQQKLINAKAVWNYPGTGITWTTYTPHTVTISKTGYQTKTIKYTMDRRREEIEVLEPAVKLLMPMGKRIYKNLKPEDGQNKVLWEEI